MIKDFPFAPDRRDACPAPIAQRGTRDFCKSNEKAFLPLTKAGGKMPCTGGAYSEARSADVRNGGPATRASKGHDRFRLVRVLACRLRRGNGGLQRFFQEEGKSLPHAFSGGYGAAPRGPIKNPTKLVPGLRGGMSPFQEEGKSLPHAFSGGHGAAPRGPIKNPTKLVPGLRGGMSPFQEDFQTEERKEVKKVMKNWLKNKAAVLTVGVGTALTAPGAFASEPDPVDVTSIISGASSTLTAVMGLCVTAAVFFTGLALAKRVKRG